MKYIIRYFCCFLPFLFSNCECERSESEAALVGFIQSHDKYDTIDKPRADTLFCAEKPLPTQTDYVMVYVVDASCSVCIAESIHCLRIYQKAKIDEIAFGFILDPRQIDLFLYYLDKAGFSQGRDYLVIPSEKTDQINKGIYLLKGNLVLDFMQWTWL